MEIGWPYLSSLSAKTHWPKRSPGVRAIGLRQTLHRILCAGVDVGPRAFAAFDGEQGVTLFVQAQAKVAFPQRGDAGEEQVHEVHGVFPFDLTAGAEVLLQLLELAHHVAVVGLVNELGNEALTRGQQFLGQRRGVFRERGVEAWSLRGSEIESNGVGVVPPFQGLVGFRELEPRASLVASLCPGLFSVGPSALSV